MYLFYLLVEFFWFGTAYLYAVPEIRAMLKENFLFIPLMPLYRILIFFFRVSGFIYAIKEPFSWKVSDPFQQTRDAIAEFGAKFRAWREGFLIDQHDGELNG